MKETKVTAGALKSVIGSIDRTFTEELLSKTEAELEDYWFFKYDKKASLSRNIYEFHDLLRLYQGFCRRWETAKNGTCCVVERVRDKYLMPKINELAQQIIEQLNAG